VIDTTFNANALNDLQSNLFLEYSNAMRTADFNPIDIAIQSTDGSILVSGSYKNGSIQVLLMRFLSDGHLDTGFTDGTTFSGLIPDYVVVNIIVATNNFDIGTSVFVLSSGKILVGGRTSNLGKLNFFVKRYNSNGSVDNNAFGLTGNGQVITLTNDTSETSLPRMLVQSDGKIIMVGASKFTTKEAFAVRYSADGIVDNSFGDSGSKVLPIGSSSVIALNSAVLDPEGKILVAGYYGTNSTIDLVMARFTSDGSIDTTFGINGVVTPSPFSVLRAAFALGVQSDGKILIGGLQLGTELDSFLIQYK